jgi:hypothetical protein
MYAAPISHAVIPDRTAGHQLSGMSERVLALVLMNNPSIADLFNAAGGVPGGETKATSRINAYS